MGRYPRGFFRFGVGCLRWLERSQAYQYLLRDEYPPYSINADARPGHEAVSAVIGFPLFVGYIALSLLPFGGLLGTGTTTVQAGVLSSRSALVGRPAGTANGLRVTLESYNDAATGPSGNKAAARGDRWISFGVDADKDGFWPVFYSPFGFTMTDCNNGAHAVGATRTAEGHAARGMIFFSSDQHETATVYFEIPTGVNPCRLTYSNGRGRVRFIFDRPHTVTTARR